MFEAARFGPLVVAWICAGASARADQPVPVIVRSERANTRYELVWRDHPTLFRSCETYRVACRHVLPIGEYVFAVPPDAHTPGDRRTMHVTGPTLVSIRPGSRTVRQVGVGMTVVGGVAAVAGFLGYSFAVTGSADQTSGPNYPAQRWGTVCVTGIILTVAGVMTYISGATTVSVSPRP